MSGSFRQPRKIDDQTDLHRPFDGTRYEVEAENGSTVMENAIRNGVPGHRGGMRRRLRLRDLPRLCRRGMDGADVGEPEPMEEDMLDFAYERAAELAAVLPDQGARRARRPGRDRPGAPGLTASRVREARIGFHESNYAKTDVVIIGAGPCGLFAVFELGLLDMKCHLIDILDRPGGQCAELYPEKPIYDIPGWPAISAQGLVDKLHRADPAVQAGIHFSGWSPSSRSWTDGGFRVTTDEDEVIRGQGGGDRRRRRLVPAEASADPRHRGL